MAIKPELAARMIAELRESPSARDYFFDKANSPEWLTPLWEAGFFADPTAPIREGDMIQFPRPYAAAFLARMADKAPVLVREIIESAKPSENPRVHEEYVKAALQMPSQEAARLGVLAQEWISQPQYPLTRLVELTGQLAAMLAETGQGDIAISLLDRLLDVGAPAESDDDRVSIRRDPRSRIEIYEYERTLENVVPRVARAVGDPVLGMLCEVLDRVLDLERRPNSAPEDFSSIWRPAIDDHPQNLPHQLKGLLVAAERDVAIDLLRSGALPPEHLIERLLDRRWKVHRRILLRALSEVDVGNPTLLGEVLVDPRFLHEREALHEFAQLEAKAFPLLTAAAQRHLLDAIDRGPDTNWIDRAAKEGRIPEPVEAYRANYIASWRRDRLGPIQAWLPEDGRRQYQELEREFGAPDPEYLTHRMTSWTGPESPISAEALAEKSDHEIHEYLAEWAPTGDRMSPSREGLGMALQRAVQLAPDRFATALPVLQLTEPTFVRSVLSGLREAAGQNKQFDWRPVLDLIIRTLERGGESFEGRSALLEAGDPDWTSSRVEAGHLISAGLRVGVAQIPIELSDQVWRVLDPLSNDRDPTVEAESTRTGTAGSATFALNCVRGVALATVVEYAVWVARARSLLPDPVQNHAFEALPNVQSVLDRHLDPAMDPSLAIRSVYGQWVPWLMLIDGAWTRERIAQMFPEDPEQEPYWDAAWESYISYNRAYPGVFEALKHQYERAIRQLRARDGDDLLVPEEHLAEHVLSMYVFGSLELSDELFEMFMRHASVTLRKRLLFSAGHALESLEGDAREGAIERSMRLWESRRAAVESGRSVPQELEPFGWWFASARLPQSWAFEQLGFLTSKGVLPEPDHLIVERLAKIANTEPLPAVVSLRRLIRNIHEPWTVYSWQEPAREIAAAGLNSADAHTRDQSRLLVNELGARGLTDLRDLLG
jgi:hypothetical protein